MYPKKIFNGYLPEGGPKLGLLFRQKQILFKISWPCRNPLLIKDGWMSAFVAVYKKTWLMFSNLTFHLSYQRGQ